MTKTITIFATDNQLFHKRLTSLNKKFAKYNTSIIIGDEYPHIKKFIVGQASILKEVISIQLSLPENVGKKGVRFLGNLSMKSGVLQAYSPDNSPVFEYYDESGKCDHCTHNRRRNTWSYFLEDGIVKQIGSTCVVDYFGFPINELFEDMDVSFSSLEIDDTPEEVDDDDIALLMGRGGNYLTLKKYLPALKKTTLDFNKTWEKADPRGTTFYSLQNYFKGNVSEISNAEYDDMVEKIKNYWPNIQANTNFEFNILANLWDDDKFIGCYPISNLGIVSWAIWKALSEKPKQDSINEYIGTVGEKIEVTGSIKLETIVENYYGLSYLYSINTDAGLLKWFSSKEIELESNKVVITATVKDHKEYKGNKETIIIRAKISQWL